MIFRGLVFCLFSLNLMATPEPPRGCGDPSLILCENQPTSGGPVCCPAKSACVFDAAGKASACKEMAPDGCPRSFQKCSSGICCPLTKACSADGTACESMCTGPGESVCTQGVCCKAGTQCVNKGGAFKCLPVIPGRCVAPQFACTAGTGHEAIPVTSCCNPGSFCKITGGTGRCCPPGFEPNPGGNPQCMGVACGDTFCAMGGQCITAPDGSKRCCPPGYERNAAGAEPLCVRVKRK